MKLLHTSDWHVGRTIRGRSRLGEHRDALGEIVDIARREQVDVALVAGDLFDTAAPSPDAEKVVYRALLDLVEAGAQVVLIAGNHDNPRRWTAVRPLLELAEVHLGSELARPDDGGTIELTTRTGETAIIGLIPFLSQRKIVKADDLMARDGYEHQGKYADRCRVIVEAMAQRFRDDTVNILLAHLTVVGGAMGGGERTAHTVFDYHVPPTVFPASAHYVALGHLHEAQQIPAAAPVWYSGSPLQLDFGEEEKPKHVLVVDAAPGTPATVEKVRLSGGRSLRTLRGTLEQVRAAAAPLGDAYLRVVLDEPGRAGLADEVRELLPNAVDVRIAGVEAEQASEAWDTDQLRQSPEALFAEYLAERNVDDPDLQMLFHELLEEAYASDQA